MLRRYSVFCRCCYVSNVVRSLVSEGAASSVGGVTSLTRCVLWWQVHASGYRYHAAYLGAAVVAASDRFQQQAVTRAIWRRHGAAAFDSTSA